MGWDGWVGALVESLPWQLSFGWKALGPAALCTLKTGFLQGLCISSVAEALRLGHHLCRASLVAQTVKSPPAMQETRV